MSHWRQVRPALLAVALGLSPLVTACGRGPLEPEEDRLAEARARWRSADVSDYDYIFRAICFCGPSATAPVEVEVVDGEVASITSVETGRPAEPAFPGEELTVEGLFQYLSGVLAGEPAAFSATYHPELGYPTSASIDFDARALDEEFGFEARHLAFVHPLLRTAPGARRP